MPIAAGILLGASAFFNGAALLATIMVLFMLAVFSDYRLEYLITAVITTGLSVLQSKCFIYGELMEPKLLFGFISEDTSLSGTLDYILRLTGIFWLVILLAFILIKGVRRYVLTAFAVPFIFSFTVSLTSDVTVNHKYIMMSLMLLGIFAVEFVVWLWDRKHILIRILSRIMCIIIITAMTVTGFYDFTTIIRRNANAVSLDQNSEVTKWIRDNTNSKELFLSSYYSLNEVVAGGGMLYYGWPYYAWSAGYDTFSREVQVRKMYEAKTSEALDALVRANNISYIIIDIDVRTSKEYDVNEAVIDATYEKVFTRDEGEWMFSIYDTRKPIY